MRFNPGRVIATRAALNTFHKAILARLLSRHVHGDWGDLSEEDKAANEDALLNEGRLLSCYAMGSEQVYCITEWDRSITTFLLPEEY
jgi:hypothetical protein